MRRSAISWIRSLTGCPHPAGARRRSDMTSVLAAGVTACQGGKADLDSESSVWDWSQCEAGVVGGGDGGDDGEAEAMPVAVAGASAAELLEGFKERADLGLGDDRSGVGDRWEERGGAGPGGRGDLSVVVVVADGVVEEVGDQSLGEFGIACGGAAAMLAWTWSPGRRARSVRPGSGSGGRSPRGRGAPGRSRPRSLVARVRSESMSRSWSAPETRSFSQTPRRVSRVVPGSARATWSRVRSTVSGVRSSWEAFATNRRWDSKDVSSRSSRSLRVMPSSLNSSSGPSRARR